MCVALLNYPMKRRARRCSHARLWCPVQVATALHRNTGEFTKFFGTELGAQTTWNEETDRAIVNGAHTTQDLQSLVFKYTELFVLCPNCRLPESGALTRARARARAVSRRPCVCVCVCVCVARERGSARGRVT